MHKNQRVTDMAVDVLARQAGDRTKRTGEPFDEALKAVLETEAGRQLGEPPEALERLALKDQRQAEEGLVAKFISSIPHRTGR
jgi:hypothetical protein